MPGVTDRAFNIHPVADNAFIVHQPFDTAAVKASHLFYVKVGKYLAIVCALFKDRNSGQPGLGTFQGQEFKQDFIVVTGNSPLGIAAVPVKPAVATPFTALDFG